MTYISCGDNAYSLDRYVPLTMYNTNGQNVCESEREREQTLCSAKRKYAGIFFSLRCDDDLTFVCCVFSSLLFKIIDILMHNRDKSRWFLCMNFIKRKSVCIFMYWLCFKASHCTYVQYVNLFDKDLWTTIIFFPNLYNLRDIHVFFLSFTAEMKRCPHGSCKIGERERKKCAEQITQVDTFLSILLIAIFLMSPKIHHSLTHSLSRLLIQSLDYIHARW